MRTDILSAKEPKVPGVIDPACGQLAAAWDVAGTRRALRDSSFAASDTRPRNYYAATQARAQRPKTESRCVTGLGAETRNIAYVL